MVSEHAPKYTRGLQNSTTDAYWKIAPGRLCPKSLLKVMLSALFSLCSLVQCTDLNRRIGPFYHDLFSVHCQCVCGELLTPNTLSIHLERRGEAPDAVGTHSSYIALQALIYRPRNRPKG